MKLKARGVVLGNPNLAAASVKGAAAMSLNVRPLPKKQQQHCLGAEEITKAGC
jgi:hypothetical protein